MRADRRGILLVLTAWLGGCNQDYPNPFVNPNRNVPLPDDAALLLSSNVYATPGAPREVYAMNRDGGNLTRITFCNSGERACDNVEASAGRDRDRLAARRVPSDADADGRLTPADGTGVIFLDLARGLEGFLLPASSRVSGLDWSAVDEIVVYSAIGGGGLDDLFRMDSNGRNIAPLTATPAISERRPRVDPSGTIAVFERIAEDGLGTIWIFVNARTQTPVSQGGAPGEPLSGTPYRVGSDADPDFSPDGGSVVFRRLTAPGNGGLGSWDVLTAQAEGTALATIVTGARYRGAPDWGPEGIVFEEIDEGGQASLVVVQPDGSGRRTIATLGAGVALSHPRWLQ
jgi:hypothetical protein